MANKYELRRRASKKTQARSDNPFALPRGYTPPPPMDRQGLTLELCLGLAVLITILYVQTGTRGLMLPRSQRQMSIQKDLQEPIIGHDFTVCDDNVYIYEKPQIISGLTWDHVVWAFVDAHEGNWHPLTWISHMIDWQLFSGGSWEPENLRYRTSWAGGHHLVSMCIHCVNTVLLFLALRLMTGTLWPSFVVATLFGVHPLRVESVAWAAERKDVLCGLFWMASMLAYAWYARRRPIRPASFFAAVGIAFLLGMLFVRLLVWPDLSPLQFTTPVVLTGMAVVGLLVYLAVTSASWLTPLVEIGSYLLITLYLALGLMSKSMIVTLPCVFMLLDVWPLGRWKKALWPPGQKDLAPDFFAVIRLLVEKIPWFAMALGDGCITYYGQNKGVALNSWEGLPLGPRVWNAVVSCGEYLRQMVWPTGLAPFYVHPAMIPDGWSSTIETQIVIYSALLSLITALAVAAIVKNLNWKWPSLTAAWFCYLCALLPVIALVQSWVITAEMQKASVTTGSVEALMATVTHRLLLLSLARATVTYGVLLLLLAPVAIVAVIKKWQWPILAIGWFWYLCALVPATIFFQGWTSTVITQIVLHGVLLSLLTGLAVAAFIEKWQWSFLTAGWFCYLGALAPLIGFLHGGKSLVHSQVIIYAVLLAPVIAAGIAALVKNWRCTFLAVGWFWYLGTLMPVIGIIQVGTQARADRYTYLPMIGVYLMVAWLLKEVADRWPKTRTALAVSATVVLVVLCAVTFRQVSYWVNSYKLFAHAVEVTDRNYFAYNHIGIAYDSDAKKMSTIGAKGAKNLFDHLADDFQGPPKKLDDALKQPLLLAGSTEDFKAAAKKLDRTQAQQLLFDYSADAFQATIDIKPDYDFGNNNLGVYYARKSKPEDLALAEKYFRGALMSNQRYADAFNNLAIILAREGKFDEAIQCHIAGLGSRGDDRASDRNNLCRVYMQKGDLDNAMKQNTIALQQCDPNFLGAWMSRTEIYLKQKDFAEAGKCVQRMISIDARSPETLQTQLMFAGNCLDHNRFDEAIDLLSQSLQIIDSVPEICHARGLVYWKKGDLNHALEDLERVERLAPHFPGIQDKLREIRRQRGSPRK